MTVDPLSIILPAIVSVAIALIELWRWRRTPRVQNAEAAKSLSDSASGLATSYKSLVEEYKAQVEKLEKELSAADSDRNRLSLLLQEEREKSNALDRLYANTELNLRKANARIAELENRNR